MRKTAELPQLLETIQQFTGKPLQVKEEALKQAYDKAAANRSGIAIKILVVIGGILSTIAFIGFLLVAGLYESEQGLLVTGVLFLAGALITQAVVDHLFLDTLAVTFYLSGVTLFAFGLGFSARSEDTVCIALIVVGLISMVIAQSYMLAFCAALLILGGSYAIILIHSDGGLMSVYNTVLILAFTAFVLLEAQIINIHPKVCKIYNPIRIAMLCTLLVTLYMGNERWLARNQQYHWMPALAAILCTLSLMPFIWKALNIQNIAIRVAIFLAAALVLAPTFWAPGIAAAVLIVLISFLVNYKTGIVLGSVALIVFVSEYYYHLAINLMTKSLVMMASGVLFLLFYILSRKQLSKP
ncbi:DUF4401 domain-containing protein [Pseudoflavitalea sp. G-6-1-2]|uniref:DUF4401 domain-containing protein n=1 Tax=Pseudoflavitalea sp. G-6-1-2 TaxID=2728841 RepID=UPI00146F4448|nr:DUF4401 domain-containing protein [Pseudoflavitalea sp. G-6-1-2]NML24089.1 DUF4401 domain-containing protein [Pseudoflavitalea sp. G-6-1-2]